MLSTFKFIATTLLLVIIANCATIVTGTTQTLNIQVLDARNEHLLSGATCTLVDGRGFRHNLTGNPSSAVVTKGQGALNISCRKPGYRQTELGVGQSFNAWTLANVIFWPGVLVDAATGAIQKYPLYITIMMEPAE